MNTTDLVSNLNISPKNKMYSKVKIVSVGESELNSSINIFNFEDVNSKFISVIFSSLLGFPS